MASLYLFDPEFCNPASGWEKGQIEKNVQDSRRRFWQNMPAFPTIDALNSWLEARCIEEWSTIQHVALPGTIAEVWAAEKASLMPLGRLFDGFVEHAKRVCESAWNKGSDSLLLQICVTRPIMALTQFCCSLDHSEAINRACRRSMFARPYICRFTSFSFVI